MTPERSWRRTAGARASTALLAVSLMTLAACGGGGGGDDSGGPITPAPDPANPALVWGSGSWGQQQWAAATSPSTLEPAAPDTESDTTH